MSSWLLVKRKQGNFTVTVPVQTAGNRAKDPRDYYDPSTHFLDVLFTVFEKGIYVTTHDDGRLQKQREVRLTVQR